MNLNNVFFPENKAVLADFSIHTGSDSSPQNDLHCLHRVLYSLITMDVSGRVDHNLFRSKLNTIAGKNVDLQNMIFDYFQKLESSKFHTTREALILLQPVIGSMYQTHSTPPSADIKKASNTRMLEQFKALKDEKEARLWFAKKANRSPATNVTFKTI